MTAHRRPPRRRARSVEVLRALGALLVLAALVGGVPVLLWRLAGWPLPHRVPSLAELRVALTRPLPDQVIATTLVALAWAWWAHFLVCLAAEAVSAVRGRMPARIVAGWLSQAIAARLIGAILLLTPSASFVQPGAIAAPRPIAATTAATAAATVPPLAQPPSNGAATTIPTRAASQPDGPGQTADHPVLKRYIVQARPPGQPHDTLWGIAQRHLGDPLRWPEIWQLNRGRPVPDPPGGRFTDEDRIWPGQELLLPPDAVDLPPVDDGATPAPPRPQPTKPRPPDTSNRRHHQPKHTHRHRPRRRPRHPLDPLLRLGLPPPRRRRRRAARATSCCGS